MAYFNDLGQKMNKVIELLLNSQNLCKLLYYNDKTPLSNPDISDTSTLMLSNIFPVPKYTGAQEDKSSRVSVYFRDFKIYEDNIGFVEPKLCFDVMSHLDCWMIDSNIRPFLVMNEIDKIFNNTYIKQISTRYIIRTFVDLVSYSDYWSGYYLVYSFTDSNYLGCK